MKVFIASLLILCVLLSGCATKLQSQPISETRLLLDTICKITVYGIEDKAIVSEALDLCAEYEALLSMTVEGSDVWRINHSGGTPVTVAQQTAEIIAAGLEYGRLTDGLFDITIGRLSALWDFTGQSGIPARSEIETARQTVDYRQVVLDGYTVQLLNPEAWIDLGGIAKGYIADMIAEFLKERQVPAAIIALGGNIVAYGQKPDGSKWLIAVRKPFGEQSDRSGILKTDEASIVSSGKYERQFVENGVLYHHILNPNTGMPVGSDIDGATILSERSMDGDALSTIVLLVGSQRAASILDAARGFIGAVLVLDSGEILTLGEVDFS